MTNMAYPRSSHLSTTFYKVVNPILRFLVVRFGFQSRDEQDALRILRVRGRKSGKLYETPVRLATFEGERYIVSLLGEAQWVRNVRAVRAAELIAAQTVESITAQEIEGKDKLAFMAWYRQMYPSRVQFSAAIDTENFSPAEIEQIANRYPVFRVVAL